MRWLSRVLLGVAGVVACAGQTPGVPLQTMSMAPSFSDGLVRLDVTVTAKDGHAVRGLRAADFTLLDNGQPQKLVTFRAHEIGADNEPAELLLMLDTLDLTGFREEEAEREAQKFLRANQGKLAHPTMFYRLREDGLRASELTSDGNKLADEIAHNSEPRRIGWQSAQSNQPLLRIGSAAARNMTALDALGAIAIEARRRPGRKLLFWLSPGWPVQAGGKSAFEELVEYSTRLREARVQLFSATEWPYLQHELGYEEFLGGVKGPKNSGPGYFDLEVLAEKSGGEAIAPVAKLSDLLIQRMLEADDYYTLTFDPPRAAGPDEYHSLEVKVDMPGAVAGTNHEYYSQPTMYDELPAQRQAVSVEELQRVLRSLSGVSDSEAAQRLAKIELTARLSHTQIAEMKTLVHGRRASEELLLLADRAAFLPPPAAEIPNDAAPSMHDQRLMLEQTLQYLHNTIPTLPDLFATRITTRFEEPAPKDNQTWKTVPQDQSLHAAAPDVVTVLVRNAKEITEANPGHKKRSKEKREHALTTEGTFGPVFAIMAIVDVVSSHGVMTWSRWEKGESGKVAVFQYRVPQESSHFETGFCCLADPDGTIPFSTKSAYHGEIALDPESGAVLRITAEAEFAPRMPMVRSALMEEYGPVAIGGKSYICPQSSVAISRSRQVRLMHQWFERFGVYAAFETTLNDVTFSDYHQFRSEHRILTDDLPVQ